MLDQVLALLGLKVGDVFTIEDEWYAKRTIHIGLSKNTLYYIDIAGDFYCQTLEGEEWSLCELQLGNILANCSSEAKFLPIGYDNK